MLPGRAEFLRKDTDCLQLLLLHRAELLPRHIACYAVTCLLRRHQS